MPTADEDLMREIQAERFEAFEILVRRHYAGLFRLALSRVMERNAAEDIVQETFLAVFAARQTYRSELPFRTWLWTIALNLCKRQVRKTMQRQSASPLVDPSQIDASTICLRVPPTLETLIAAERDAHLHLVLQQLPEVQADALRLRFFGGLKFEEIAAAMDCSLITAKIRVKHGLLKLTQMVPVPVEREP